MVTPEDDGQDTQASQPSQPAQTAKPAQASQTSQSGQSTSQQPAATKKKPQTAKTQTTKKPASSQPDYDNLGSAPVVLVPPSKQAMAQSQGADTTTAPVTQAEQPPTQAGTQAANPQKRKSIFDLFNGSGSSTTTTTTEPAAPTQVASAAQQTKQATPPATKAAAPTQPQASAGSSGYVIQLASFRTQAEAQSEYSRIAKSYPSVVGSLRSQIRQTNVAGSTRYQLGLGPLPTRGDATRVCGELIAAGESDCIVRGP